MPFADVCFAVYLADKAVIGQRAVIGAQPHRTAEIISARAPFDFVSAGPLGHQANNRICTGSEFRRSCAFNPGKAPRSLDHGHLHTETDAEIWHVVFARKLHGGNFAFRATLAKSARHQNTFHIGQMMNGVFGFEYLGIDPVHIHANIICDPAVIQRLGK